MQNLISRPQMKNQPYGLLRWLISMPGLALVYLLAIAVAETITTLSNPLIGLGQHAVLLLILFVHATLNWERPERDLLLSLTLAPLIRILSLSMPLANFPLLYWYVMISAPLLLAAGLLASTLGLSRGKLGLQLQNLSLQAMVAISGPILGFLEFLILRPEPLAVEFTMSELWLPALILLFCTGLTEELIFRGVIQRAAERTLGRFGIPYVSLVFAALHIGYKSLLDIFFVFLVALFFGWMVSKTRSLLGVTLAHGLINITLFLIAPFLLGFPTESRPIVPTPVPMISPLPPTRQVVVTNTSEMTPSPRANAALPAPINGKTSTEEPPYTSTPTQRVRVHVVEPGENLYRIGLTYGVPWPTLAAANGLPDGNQLYSEQILIIPDLRPTLTPVGD